MQMEMAPGGGQPGVPLPFDAAGPAIGAGPIRVVIVEDHRVVAEGLQLALGNAPGLEVVGLAHTAAEALELASTGRPDVILMDFHLPGGEGAATIWRLRELLPGAAVLVLSADSTPETLLLAVEAGASGYLVKTQSAGQVIEAVRRAADGEMLIPAATLAGLIGRQRRRSGQEAERDRIRALLTPREVEVLTLMSRGLDNKAIAARLHISFTTVRGHVQSILSKLGAHSKLEAVVRASELGLTQREAGG